MVSDLQNVAIHFARARHNKRLVVFVAVAREHDFSVVVFKNTDGRDCVFTLCGVETVVVVILLRGAIEHKAVCRLFDDNAIGVFIGINVEHDFAIRLCERGDEKLRIRDRLHSVGIGES